MQGPWKGRVPADSSVVLEVDIAGVKSGHRSSLTDSGESAPDSRYIQSCCSVTLSPVLVFLPVWKPIIDVILINFILFRLCSGFTVPMSTAPAVGALSHKEPASAWNL